MANLIQIKRSLTATAPGSLADGELAFTSNGDILFIGNDGVVDPIGGKRYPGTLTANQALVANSTSGIDKVIVANLVPTAIYANGSFGTAGQALVTNGTSLYWGTVVAGTNTQVQFNDSGAANGSSSFTFNKSTSTLTVTNLSGNGASVTSVDAATVGGNTASTLRSYSDTVAGTAYSNAVSSATALAGNAYSNAVSAATALAGNAYSNAVSAATALAGNAYSNAVSYVDGLRLDSVSNSSITYVATANSVKTAYDAAIAANTRAASAQTAASDAYSNAIAYAASNTYVNSTFATNTYVNSTFAGNSYVTSTFATNSYVTSTFAALSGATFTGGVSFTDLTVSGNLTINGTLTTIDTDNVIVEDSLIKLARNNGAGDSLDIGFYGMFDNGGTDKYAGLFRDATDGKFKLFTDLQSDPTTTVNTSGTGYNVATLLAAVDSYGLVSNSTVTNITANGSLSVAIVANTLTLSTPLAATSGGTGLNTYTSGDIIVANTGNALSKLSLGTAGQILQSNGSALVYATLDGGSF